MEKAGPMMLKVIEENSQVYFMENSKGVAAKGNAVELKGNLVFPKLLLHLFSGADRLPATLVKVSCLHMFESSPNDKIAVAYVIKKPNSKILIYLVLVFSVTTKKFLNIL